MKPLDGIVASSFKANEKVFISGDKLLPLERFLPKPKALTRVAKKKPRGPRAEDGSSRGGRGGRGGFSRGGGNGFGRGGFRGGRGGGFRGSRGGGSSRGGFSR